METKAFIDPASQEASTVKTEDFSLILGGPVYQFFLRTGLVKPPLHRVQWRMLVISMATWAPLLILTLVQGRLLSGVKIPFLYDFEVHVRLLISLPLLILAELTIHGRMKLMVSQFLQRGIITPALRPRFEQILASAMSLRNSTAAEMGILALVLIGGGLVWREFIGISSDTWYSTATNGGAVRTSAGLWYQFVSVPISQFILLRWYFRLIIWMRLLRQVSKLDLNLVPTHPDKSCGLGFLDATVFAMAPLLLAHSSVLAGTLANRLIHEGEKLPSHYLEIGLLAAFLALLALGPLCLFTGNLLRARMLGLQTYGRFASDYVMSFDRKWIGGQRAPDQTLAGTDEISALADLGQAFSVVRSIVPFPFGRSSIVNLAVIIALPLLPLALTMFSLQELLVRLLKLIL